MKGYKSQQFWSGLGTKLIKKNGLQNFLDFVITDKAMWQTDKC